MEGTKQRKEQRRADEKGGVELEGAGGRGEGVAEEGRE